jgi:HEPN domain-containing protein
VPDNNKWLEFVLDDLDSAEIMLREKKFNNVCYFSHQAVEKVLKAFLEHHKMNPPHIHNLIDLLNQCGNINQEIPKLLPKVRILNQFYIPTRYPVAPIGSTPKGMPNQTLAEKALDYAKEIIDYVKAQIN